MRLCLYITTISAVLQLKYDCQAGVGTLNVLIDWGRGVWGGGQPFHTCAASQRLKVVNVRALPSCPVDIEALGACPIFSWKKSSTFLCSILPDLDTSLLLGTSHHCCKVGHCCWNSTLQSLKPALVSTNPPTNQTQNFNFNHGYQLSPDRKCKLTIAKLKGLAFIDRVRIKPYKNFRLITFHFN